MTPQEELMPALIGLREAHSELPFMGKMIPADRAIFRALPEGMSDLLVASQDFVLPARGSGPIWTTLLDPDGRELTLIVARSEVDGELWVIAPDRSGEN